MKGSSIFFAFLFIFLGLIISSSLVNSQASDSCNSRLDLGSPLPFDTTSLTCNNVWSPHGYVLRYAQAQQGVWNFVLSAPNPGSYIAIGFSPNGRMVGSSAIVAWAASNDVPTIKRYYLGGQTPSQVEPDQGNLQVGNSTVIVQNSQINMVFQLVNTDRPESQLLYAVGPRGVLPSSNNRLTQHMDMISTSINYATGQSETQGDPEANLKRTHGILNMLGWGILLPIGIIIARYLKKYDPLWFYSHSIVQSIGFIFGVAGVICGLVLDNRLDNNVDKHKGIGIAILAFGCLQVIAFLARPSKESKVRKYWNWYHYTIGRVLIVLAVANIFYGIHLAHAGRGWNAGYGAVLAILFITALILEARMWLTPEK